MENLNQAQPQVPTQTQIGGQPVTAPAPVVAPIPAAATPAPPTGATPAAPSAGDELGSLGLRAVASIVDGFLVGIVNFGFVFFITLLFSGADQVSAGASVLLSFLPMIVPLVYFTTMDVKFGATLGKKALGLRVQNITTGENLNWVEAILRESVGRAVSIMALGLGYLWVFWDKDKQGWHDKIAKSVVVKAK